MHATVPDRSEAAPYYFTYIDLVEAGDIRDALLSQAAQMEPVLASISEQQSLLRYAADKWSIREVLGHLNDTERLFVFRAFWFARGFDSELPSFDQNIAHAAAASQQRSWRSLVDEFHAIRRSTIHFFLNLPDEAWARRGIASGNPFTVRALAYMCVGHVTHHVRILRDRYLSTPISI